MYSRIERGDLIYRNFLTKHKICSWCICKNHILCSFYIDIYIKKNEIIYKYLVSFQFSSWGLYSSWLCLIVHIPFVLCCKKLELWDCAYSVASFSREGFNKYMGLEICGKTQSVSMYLFGRVLMSGDGWYFNKKKLILTGCQQTRVDELCVGQHQICHANVMKISWCKIYTDVNAKNKTTSYVLI